MTYKGSCHCGRIAFEAEGEIDQAITCNCSMCERKGSMLWFIPRAQFKLLTPEADLSTYTFNKHAIKHQFCPTCGMHPFAVGEHPTDGEMAAVNVRCLEGVDLSSISVKHVDGRSN